MGWTTLPIDISGMVYNEEEINAMIAKVNTYRKQKGKSLNVIASEIGYSNTSISSISKFLMKNKGLSEATTLSVLKRFQLFFEKIEAAGNIVEPEHTLQAIVDQLTRENAAQKAMIETTNVDISGMVYNEEEIDAMIAKVNPYRKQKGKSLRDVAEDIGYRRQSYSHVSKFLNKTIESKSHMLYVLKRFQLFFEKIEAAGNIVEPEHPLQEIVDELTRENAAQKAMIESTNIDTSGMVYNEEEIDAMIAKVNTYRKQKGKSLRDVAEDIGYSRRSDSNLSNFLKKIIIRKSGMLYILKRFQLFFERIEASGNIVEPEHPLQAIVDQLTRENARQKTMIETLNVVFNRQLHEMAEFEKIVEQIPNLRVDPPTFYETPVKVEVSSQSSQNTLERNAKEARRALLKNRLREIVADLREKRRRRIWKTYLIVDEDGKGKYAGMTGQKLRKRVIEHVYKNLPNKELENWVATQQHLNVYTIHEGSEEECALMESLLINLRRELGFDLLNIRDEKHRTKTPTKRLEIDDEGEISVTIEALPMNADDKGHDQFVADVRYMVEKAMDQSPLRLKIPSRASAKRDKSDEESEESEPESDDERESDEESEESEPESDDDMVDASYFCGPSPKKRRILSP